MSDPTPSSRRSHRRWKSRKRGPLFAAIWFTLNGLNWFALIVLALTYLRPHPLTSDDYVVGAVGLGLGLFYLWVAYAVYRRRRYILTVAFACAGFGLFGFPFGTIISIFLLTDLVSRKHDFTK